MNKTNNKNSVTTVIVRKPKKQGANSDKRRFLTESTSMVPRQLGFNFPRRLAVTHRYVDQTAITSTSGVMANYRFRTNGLFDPNHTAAGHQPSYYDNLTAIYDHWVVLRSHIKLTAFPASTITIPIAFGVAINDDTSTANTSYVAYRESSFCKLNYFAPANALPKTLEMEWSSRAVFNGDPLGNPDLWGSVSADPSEEQIFNVFVQAVDQIATAAIQLVAEITYETVWFELKDLVVS
jgi:hypothetical protein